MAFYRYFCSIRFHRRSYKNTHAHLFFSPRGGYPFRRIAINVRSENSAGNGSRTQSPCCLISGYRDRTAFGNGWGRGWNFFEPGFDPLWMGRAQEDRCDLSFLHFNKFLRRITGKICSARFSTPSDSGLHDFGITFWWNPWSPIGGRSLLREIAQAYSCRSSSSRHAKTSLLQSLRNRLQLFCHNIFTFSDSMDHNTCLHPVVFERKI